MRLRLHSLGTEEQEYLQALGGVGSRLWIEFTPSVSEPCFEQF